MNGLGDKIISSETRFELFFRAVSYAAVVCGFSALWVSGSIGVLATALFVSVVVAGWMLEGSRWQIGEKLGTALIVLSLPAFYGYWQLAPLSDGIWIAGLLARMILCLTAVKLLQRKSDRDWIFLYLMAFFEVLLAAGLSISAIYLINFLVYLFVMACAVIAFEIRKTSRAVRGGITASQPDNANPPAALRAIKVGRIPAAAASIIVFIVLFAVPLFFLLPRVGGAGLGGSQLGQSVSGFSDKVTLGNFGRITEDDRVVMRVKFDELAAITNNLYFRGMAFDTFDNRSWNRTESEPEPKKSSYPKGEIELDRIVPRGPLLGQTIYLEPLDTPVLFGLTRPVSIRGNFDSVRIDKFDSIQHLRPSERISYRVRSETNPPPLNELLADRAPYSDEYAAYRSLPANLDPRIARLAAEIASPYDNRYEKARAIESHLQTKFGYTLEQKAGGSEPLAQFLFDVREGHCEYFASALAILLRTQGIATRVVTGFHGGDYNETSGMTVVRQRHAHAWVEVYFPGVDSWVTFDPTPIGSQPGGSGAGTGLAGTFSSYAEALEAMWIEYFVAFDEQGQRGLRASAFSEFSKFQNTALTAVGVAHQLSNEWLATVRGDNGRAAAISSLAYSAAAILGSVALIFGLLWVGKSLAGLGLIRRVRLRHRAHSIRPVEFYEQLIMLLASRGLRRASNQTPLEFAVATNLPEALTITEMYQRVRFGEQELTASETAQMSELIRRLKHRGGDYES